MTAVCIEAVVSAGTAVSQDIKPHAVLLGKLETGKKTKTKKNTATGSITILTESTSRSIIGKNI